MVCLALSGPAWAAPDFDAVAWVQLGCDTPKLISPSSPRATSFAGDHANPPAFYAYDADYLYFRYRMDDKPGSGSDFAQYVWTALVQVPSGNRFQYQYQLSLNGKSDTLEIWANTTASDVKFPHFQDMSEVKLHSVPVGSLARTVAAGTSFNGQPDWFLDFAFPVSTLVAKGVIANAGDLASTLFFPASSTNPNNYTKSFLNCPFQPVAPLAFSKTVTPTVALPGEVTPVTYTIGVRNVGTMVAAGVVVEDVQFPAFFGNVQAGFTTDDPVAACTLESQNPLLVKCPTLGAGRRLTVVITADAAPTCGTADFVNTASGRATNTFTRQASAPIGYDACDGADNDCDGQVDEGAALCDDQDPCTVDVCDGESGCAHEPIPDCVACVSDAECADADPCTTDICSGGECTSYALPGCPAETPGDGSGGGGPGGDGGGPGGDGGGPGGDDAGGGGGPGGSGCRGRGCTDGPAAPDAEVCGDCRDNDGDGLVDYEDPDCCPQVDALALRRMVMRLRPQPSDDTLRLRSRPSAVAAAGLDPERDGVTLQLSDRDGRLYCHDLALVTTPAARKRGVYRFKDKSGKRAAGLQRARLKIRTDGRMVFRAAGSRMDLRTPADGELKVTLRAGDQCVQTTALLRSQPAKGGSRNVFP